jgi:carboxyl-terminal processing protease
MYRKKIKAWLGAALVLTAFSIEAKEDQQNAFHRLQQVADHIRHNYHEEIADERLARAGIDGMLGALDPYSQYLEREPLSRFIMATKGEYAGLGCRIQQVYPDSVIGVSLLLHADTPAARAGIRSGDLILAIDDSTTKGMVAATAAELIRGTAGSQVKLLLKRTGMEEPFELRVERAPVHMSNVEFKTLFEDKTGYVKMDAFRQDSGEECKAAVSALMTEGMERLILDLRGNGGGLLSQAVVVADLFLPEDHLVISTIGRASSDTTHYYTQGPSAIGDRPLVVLVDNHSASAAEIVAGAVQDWDRGLVLGMPTVGKGSVQEVITISPNAELKLTTAIYILPSGRSIDKRMRRDSSLVDTDEKVFKTRRQERTIYNRGGLDPDIIVEGREVTPLFEQLWGWSGDHTFFHFSSHYGTQGQDLSAAFRADKNTLKAFRQFIEGRDFEYISPIEVRYQHLEEAAEEDELKKLSKSLKKIKEGIDRIEEKHWNKNEALITWKLTYDILEKNIDLDAALSYETSVNPFIQRAREVLNNGQDYGEWLANGEIGKKPEEEEAAQESEE